MQNRRGGGIGRDVYGGVLLHSWITYVSIPEASVISLHHTLG